MEACLLTRSWALSNADHKGELASTREISGHFLLGEVTEPNYNFLFYNEQMVHLKENLHHQICLCGC